MNCRIDGCFSESKLKGLCSSHYWRWLRYKDFNVRKRNERIPCKKCGTTVGKMKNGFCLKHHYIYRNQTPRRKYQMYKIAARKRNILFEISFNEFMKFWGMKCDYCGRDIKTVGIDRIDSLKGYEKSNVVSCCQICNKMKMKMKRNDFIEACKLVAIHLKLT